MSSEWPLVRIEDIAANQPSAMATGPFGSSISAKFFQESGIPVIRGSNLSADVQIKIDDSGLVFVSEDKAKEFPRCIVSNGDLVFTCWGTINQVGLIDDTATYQKYLISNKQMKLTVDRTKADPRFVYYVFSGPTKQSEIIENGIGSSVPGFNLGQLRKHSFRLPPLEEQAAIADLLDIFSNRIALLRETNATLEAIAQALFKSWFVNLDPVHARARGEEPAGLAPEVAALFPASFEESELGIVPKGWRVGTLADLSDLNPESWTSRTHPESVRYVDLANTKDNVIAEVTEFSFEEAPSRARRVLRDGDTIVGTVRPGNRSFAFISNASANLTGSTGFAVLRPRHDRNTEFVFLAATSDNSIDHLAHVADGGAYPAVRSEVVSGLSCVVPDGDVLCAFHEVAQPIFNKVAANHQQAQTLATLRDTLLPRLISGQLRLPEAESLVEATL
ncbi:restriction endonuclease subunit S [Aeromonas hydrophila]|uniref:restriction endonuclease subunit S n=1 Tax=Aeromonas hydrophila TaxID=644 RepID=UPI003EC65A1E